MLGAMDDAALIEAVLDRYRGRFTGWEPPPPGSLAGPAGGFSGGPYGLAVRFVLRGPAEARECVWLETSRMGGTSLMRLGADGGEPEHLGEMQEMYVNGATEDDTRRAQEEMWARNAAFWARVEELGLGDRLPVRTAVNAVLTSGPHDPPGSGGAPGA